MFNFLQNNYCNVKLYYFYVNDAIYWEFNWLDIRNLTRLKYYNQKSDLQGN